MTKTPREASAGAEPVPPANELEAEPAAATLELAEQVLDWVADNPGLKQTERYERFSEHE